MNFQILNIAVYNARGDRREIEFKPGRVNIITGGSKTGKTALIHIVDYCLGRTECAVPIGVIRDSVAWYAVRIQTDDSQIVIARPSPPSTTIALKGDDAAYDVASGRTGHTARIR